MKKILLTLFIALFHYGYALPIGNPTEPSWFESNGCCEENFRWKNIYVRLGFYGNYVFNRHMKSENGRDVDTTKLFTNAGYIALNFCDRIALFSTLGASRLSLNTSLVAFNMIDPHPLFELEGGTAFSYSVGAKAILLKYKSLVAGVSGEYFSTRPNVKRLYIAAGAVSYPDNILETRYSEWQVAFGVACRYNAFFIPYAAIKYAGAFWRLNNGRRFIIESNTNTFLFNLRNGKQLGYALGLTFCPFDEERMAITAEARFGDEKALHINGQLRF